MNRDAVVEANESFRVRLGTISGVNAQAAGRITLVGSPSDGTILDDDTASLSITGPASQAEGTGGTFSDYVFQVQLSAAVQGGLRVNYTTDDGTATLADGDYEDNDGQLNFAGTAGESREVRVRVKHDARVEREETFAVALGDSVGAQRSESRRPNCSPRESATGPYHQRRCGHRLFCRGFRQHD